METNINAQGKARSLGQKLPGFPKSAGTLVNGSWMHGAVKRFKENQRLPLIPGEKRAADFVALNTPADLDFANFYHL